MPNLVENRYLVGDQLGTGGMGTVYRGWDTRLQRDVAIKRLNMLGRQAEVEQFLKRFEREAIAMAQLQHPNIVRVLDFGRDDDGVFLILEYMAGGSLRDRMRAPFEPQAAAAILSPIAEALHSVHEQGMIHRDVKPSNILFNARGIPMLTDFGIVKLVEDAPGNTLTATGMAVGTPTYMAPELIGGEFDYRVDQYALGIIFYEMVTGKPPFKGRTPMEAMVAHKFEPLPDPRGFHPGLSEQTCALLQRVLAKEPEQRFADTSQFALALRNIAASSNAPATPPVRTPDETETQDIPTPAKAMPIIPSAPQVNWNAYQAPASEPVMAERGAAVPPAPAPMVMEPAAKAAVPGWVWAVGAAGFFALIALIIGGILVMKNLGVFSKPATEEAQTWQSEDEEEPLEEKATELPEATAAPEAVETSVVLDSLVINAGNASMVGVNTIYGMGTNHRTAYSPDNSWIAVGNSSGLYFVDSQTGAILNQMPGMVVRLLEFSPDGSLLATLNGDGYLYIWDVTDLYSAALVISYQAAPDGSSNFASLDFSPDGTRIAYSVNDHIYVFSITSGSITNDISLNGNWAYDVEFRPDDGGYTLFVANYSSNIITAYDTDTNSPMVDLMVQSVSTFAISPDGSLLAAIDSLNQDVLVFQLSDYSLQRVIDPPSWINDLAFSSDGQFLFGSDGTSQLMRWDLYNDYAQYNYTVDTIYLNTLSIANNGQYAAWSGYRDWGVIDLITGYAVFDSSAFDAFDLFPDNINGGFYKYYTDYTSSVIHVYDVFQEIELFSLNTSAVNNYLWPVVVSPDGSLLAGSSYNGDHYMLSVWNIYSQQLLYTVDLSGYPDELRFSSDGQKVVAACAGNVTIYDLYGGVWFSYTAPNTVSTAKYYAEYDLLLLGGYFKPLVIYPGSGAAFELPFDNSSYYVGDIELSADGNRVYMAWGYNLYGYDLVSSSLFMEFVNYFSNVLSELAVNDSETLLAVGDEMGNISLIDIQNLSLVNDLRWHTNYIYFLDFAVSDQILFSAGYDGQQIVWSLQ